MAKNDGGPAFPVIAENGLGHVSDGMSLRDWFAGHAPTVPWEFSSRDKPVDPGFPPIPSDLKGEEKLAATIAANEEHSRLYAEYLDALAAWQAGREAAWRYAYADAMLATRDRDQ